jgi:hypothetical protein
VPVTLAAEEGDEDAGEQKKSAAEDDADYSGYWHAGLKVKSVFIEVMTAGKEESTQ